MRTDFSQEGVTFSQSAEGCPILQLASPECQATLSLVGGQMLQYQGSNAQPLLYLSPQAILRPGHAIRGGIPICWPWFGPHAHDARAPQHGIARSHTWQLQQLERTSSGFAIQLQGPALDGLSVRLHYHIGTQLQVELITSNHGTGPASYSAALHSYLAVSDVTQIQLHGLGQSRFLDKLTGTIGQHSAQPLAYQGEIDQIVYTQQALELSDPLWSRRTRIETQGSASMVLWNPGEQRAQALKDLPDDDWRRFFCVEAANAADDARTLQPGCSHTLSTRLHTIPL